MAKLAIVIPALSGPELLEEGLVSVLQHRPAETEVLVVLTEPYADPYDLKDEVQFLLAPRGAGLVHCLQLGLATAEAPIVHFLASGRQVGEDWADRALAHFDDDPQVAAVVPMTRRAEGDYAGVQYRAGGRRVLQRVTRLDKPVAVLGPELGAAFYRRTALEAVGSLELAVGDELLDVELALAFEQAGWRRVFEPAAQIEVLHEEQRRPRAFRAGLHAERLFWRNAPARGWGRSLAGHPWAVVHSLTQQGLLGLVPHALGRLVGSLQRSQAEQHRQRLVALRTNPPVLAVRRDAEQGLRIDAAHAAEYGSPHATSYVTAHRKSA